MKHILAFLDKYSGKYWEMAYWRYRHRSTLRQAMGIAELIHLNHSESE